MILVIDKNDLPLQGSGEFNAGWCRVEGGQGSTLVNHRSSLGKWSRQNVDDYV